MNIAIINCFDLAEHRVDLLLELFTKRGHNVNVYTSNFKHIEKVERNDYKEHYTFINVKKYYKNISFQRIFSHLDFAKKVTSEYLCKENVDLIWVMIPPNSLVKQTIKYKRKVKCKVIVDVIDMWPETMPIEKIKKIPLISVWRNLRDKWINQADFIVTECNLYQEILGKIVPKDKMKTVYLAKKIKPIIINRNPPQNKIALCYLGSINNIIDIEVISEIICKFKKCNDVELHIIGDGENRDKLIDTAQNEGAVVVYHGKIYDADKKMEILNSCHYGLNIMRDTVYVGLTMKSMDYFESGIPIINNIKGDTWTILEKNKIGINYDKDTDLVKEHESYNKFNEVRKYFIDNLSMERFESQVTEILDIL